MSIIVRLPWVAYIKAIIYHSTIIMMRLRCMYSSAFLEQEISYGNNLFFFYKWCSLFKKFTYRIYLWDWWGTVQEFPYLIGEIDKQVPFIHSKRIVEGTELSLYIVTTMSCNLTCSYCFENDKDRKPSLSSEYDGKKIVNFIYKYLKL